MLCSMERRNGLLWTIGRSCYMQVCYHMEFSLKLCEYTWWKVIKSHGWWFSLSSLSWSKDSMILIAWQGRTGWKLSHFSGHCRVTHLLVAILPHTRMHWNFEKKKLLVQLYTISRKEERCMLVQNGSFVGEGVRQNQQSIFNRTSYLSSHIPEYFSTIHRHFSFYVTMKPATEEIRVCCHQCYL